MAVVEIAGRLEEMAEPLAVRSDAEQNDTTQDVLHDRFGFGEGQARRKERQPLSPPQC